MTRPHYRTDQIGQRLSHHIAPAVTLALELLQQQRNNADGWPTRGETPTRGNGDNSTTETATINADYWTAKAAEITDVIEGIEIAVGYLAKLVIGIDRTPAAGELKRCSDGQQGKDAPLWSDDLHCRALPDKRDLCQRHYSKWRRYLESHDVDTSHHFEPC